MVEAVQKSLESYNRLQGKADGPSTSLHVRWIRPEVGDIALNCDGSVTDSGNVATCGGSGRS